MPPGAKLRQWTLRDDNFQHYHGRVQMSESPLYVWLRWRSNTTSQVQDIGIYRLHLRALLAENYIRRERSDADEELRLRFYRAHDRIIYIQAKRDSPALPIASIVTNPQEELDAVPLMPPSVRATLRDAAGSMFVDFAILKKDCVKDTTTFEAVGRLAARLRQHLDKDETQRLIRERHILGASSAGIQEAILAGATELGFQTERRGLFGSYPVAALRPDYFCPVNETGVLLEVERGKTIANNMDLLDLWKCHICEHAKYLFLVVPKQRPSANGSMQSHFTHVRKRLTPFFESKNYVNVDAVFLFGY
jgi:hypothetical protein